MCYSPGSNQGPHEGMHVQNVLICHFEKTMDMSFGGMDDRDHCLPFLKQWTQAGGMDNRDHCFFPF